MPCVTGSSEADHALPDEPAEETVLSEAQVKERTERFLFGDPAGVKASGPIGAATRATLALVVTCLAVQKELWSSRRPEIKALLADEQGRFDKEELLAHIINDALGRPLLPAGKATRDVGTAANNALKKEKKETAETKSRTSSAVSAARVAARKDPALLPGVAAAEAARAAELAAVLAQEYDFNLPNFTVGAKRKAPDLSEVLRRAEAAHRAAEQELARTQHELDSLGPQPTIEYPADLDDKAGEAAALRLWEREKEIRDRATQAYLAAHTARCQCTEELFAARVAYYEPEEGEEANRRRREEMERRFSSLSQSLKELPQLIQVRRPHARCLSVAPLSCRFRCAGFDRFGYQTPKIFPGGLEG